MLKSMVVLARQAGDGSLHAREKAVRSAFSSAVLPPNQRMLYGAEIDAPHEPCRIIGSSLRFRRVRMYAGRVVQYYTRDCDRANVRKIVREM